MKTPGSITSDISDALLTGIQQLFGKTLRKVDTHPGQWSDSARQADYQYRTGGLCCLAGQSPGRDTSYRH
ncbi:phage protein Gp37 [Photorhabdus laumondii]|uniref:phage protein Gp37 n=1 Tax=Photorhabdus laumondii TaxID=2218628 RepID=UPI0022AA2D97|nr:phage protein Gp37 [Photorhabdus laumondii]